MKKEKKKWKYEVDPMAVLAGCPTCKRQMIFHSYMNRNPYKFRPYCGEALEEDKEEFRMKRLQVFGKE